MWQSLICISFLIGFISATGPLDLECSTNEDCSDYADDHTNSTCVAKQCKCWTAGLNMQVECRPAADRKSNAIGMKCPCDLIKDTFCSKADNVCLCKENYIPDKDKRRCIKKKVELGESCEDNSQCLKYTPFSECDLKAKKCVCQNNFTRVGTTCHSKAGLKDRCEVNDECEKLTKHAMCKSHECICGPNWVANNNLTECLPIKTYNETCIESTQCQHKLGVGSVCDSGVCVCDENHQMIEQFDSETKRMRIECDIHTSYGDYCTEHNECRPLQEYAHPSMYCFMFECHCMDGFVRSGSKCVLESSSSGSLHTHGTLVLLTGVALTVAQHIF